MVFFNTYLRHTADINYFIIIFEQLAVCKVHYSDCEPSTYTVVVVYSQLGLGSLKLYYFNPFYFKVLYNTRL